jgi:hypothetical protein
MAPENWVTPNLAEAQDANCLVHLVLERIEIRAVLWRSEVHTQKFEWVVHVVE